MKKMNKKGFTLIEMLAVIAIIAVLVAIIVPAVGSSTTKAKASTDAANLRSFLSAATIEYASNGLNASKQLDMTIDQPECKSLKAAEGSTITVQVWMEGDELVAYFVNGSDYYNIKSFSDVADGTSTAPAKADTPSASTTVYKVFG